jgi:hypothetical protein
MLPKYRRLFSRERSSADLALGKSRELDDDPGLEISRPRVFIEFDPRWAVAEIANRFKDYTSRMCTKNLRTCVRGCLLSGRDRTMREP